MPTAQMAAEQIVIGALVLAAATLPWAHELHGRFAGNPLVSGGVLLGMCYMLGVVFDRIADTLTEELDRHHRLRFGLFALRDKGIGLPDPARDSARHDVYEEDAYRRTALRDSDAVVAFIDYHRSRVRLTRALALYVPSVTLAAVIAGSQPREVPSSGSPLHPYWILVVPVVLAVFAWRGAKRTEGDRDKIWRDRSLAVRTYSPQVRAYAEAHGFLDDTENGDEKRRDALRDVLLIDSVVQANGVLLIAGLALAARARMALTLLLWGVGTGLSLMSAVAWWRISATYRTYLRDFARNPPAVQKN